jgi:hypothetical protein
MYAWTVGESNAGVAWAGSDADITGGVCALNRVLTRRES